MTTPPVITINSNRISRDEDYMQRAEIIAKRSKANRLQVGAILVKDNRAISDGYNGMPAGEIDDVCEMWDFGPQGKSEPLMVTKRETLHAESNVLMKLARAGGVGAEGATLYTVYSPCFECAKLIKQAGIIRLVYRNEYRDPDGIKFLMERGVQVDQLVPIQPSAPPRQAAPMPVKPSPAPAMSILKQITAPDPNDMVSQLRARGPITPPIKPVEPIVGQTDFQPVTSEDEVAALLRAHEAAIRLTGPAKSNDTETTTESFRSTFL